MSIRLSHFHIFKATIKNRLDGIKCPFCFGKHELCLCQSLQAKFPKLAKQLHPILNGNIDASKIPAYSNTILHWICAVRLEKSKCVKECTVEHEWQASVKDRTSGGKNCPCCFGGGNGGKFCPCQSLEARYPKVAADLHPEKKRWIRVYVHQPPLTTHVHTSTYIPTTPQNQSNRPPTTPSPAPASASASSPAPWRWRPSAYIYNIFSCGRVRSRGWGFGIHVI